MSQTALNFTKLSLPAGEKHTYWLDLFGFLSEILVWVLGHFSEVSLSLRRTFECLNVLISAKATEDPTTREAIR